MSTACRMPEDYCRKLRARLHALETRAAGACPAGPAYFVVEKILARDEKLPQELGNGWHHRLRFHG